LFAVVVPDMTALSERRVANLREYIRNEIDTLSVQLPPHKRVSGFQLMREDLPRTTTRKIKRFVVHQLLDGSETDQQQGAPAGRDWTEEDRAWAASPLGAKILQIIQASSPAAPASVHPDDSLELDLQFDSLGRIELTVALQQAVGAKLRPDEAAECYTVRDLATALQRAIPAGSATDMQGTELVPGWPKLLDEALLDDADVALPRPPGPLIDVGRYCVLKMLAAAARLFLRLDVRGLENLPGDGPFIICANHQSYIDGVLLFSVLPYRVVRRIVSLGKPRVFGRAPMRWLASRLNIAFIDADSNLVKAMQISARALYKKQVLLFFPEGERSLDGEIQPMRRGAAILSCHLRAPILPVVIDGPHKIWPRGRGIQKLVPVAIRVLRPILPSASGPPIHAAAFDDETARLTADLQSKMKLALGAIRSPAPATSA
jgi:long-chain acyl-CoA synthetase